MTKVMLLNDLKNILVNNIEELNRETQFKKLSISFRGGKFYVKKNGGIIHRGNLFDVDLDFNGQKKFIFDVLNKLTTFVRDYFSIDWENEEKLLLSEDECDMVDVVGFGNIYKNNFVKIDEKLTEHPYIRDIIKKIRGKFCNRGIVVVYCKDKKGFYVDGITYEDEICLKCINDLNDVVDGYDNGNVTLYYKVATDKEIKKAVKFIEKLVKS